MSLRWILRSGGNVYVRLTESENARSEQLLVMPTQLLTNREWLPGELLSGSNVEGLADLNIRLVSLHFALTLIH